jgi:hypothetical protein
MGKRWGRQPKVVRTELSAIVQRKQFLLNVCMSVIQRELGGDRINAGAAKAAIDRFAFDCADIKNITLESSVSELGLPLRLTNALERYGFDRLSVLVAAKSSELLEYEDIAAGNVEVIREKLAEHGLRLKGDPKPISQLL